MWISPEDARTDIALVVGAAFVVGPAALVVLASIPGWPGGVVTTVVTLLALVAIMIVPPRWLANWRGQGTGAFGLVPEGRASLSNGVVLALPIVAAGVVDGVVGQRGAGLALGRIGQVAGGIDAPTTVATVIAAAIVAVVGAAIVLAHGMISARSADAFRSDELRLVEGLRTFGIGAAGLASVLGLLVLVTGARSLVGLGLDIVPLVLLVLLVDRQVDPGDRVTRAGILAPAIIALVAVLYANVGFSLFGGDLLGGLYVGALAAGLSVVVTTLVTTRRASWAFVPVLIASAWSPTCLSLPTFISTCVVA